MAKSEVHKHAEREATREHGTRMETIVRGLRRGGIILGGGTVGLAMLPFLENPSVLVRTVATAGVFVGAIAAGGELAIEEGQVVSRGKRLLYSLEMGAEMMAGMAVKYGTEVHTTTAKLIGIGGAIIGGEQVIRHAITPLWLRRRHRKNVFNDTLDTLMQQKTSFSASPFLYSPGITDANTVTSLHDKIQPKSSGSDFYQRPN